MAVCSGTKRNGEPCRANPTPGSRYCWHHDPNYAEDRRRNASRAATLGNSKIGSEIRATRLMVRDLVEMVISNELHPLVRKRLAEVVQLVQSYCRLAELEVASGEAPRCPGKGYAALPEDTAGKAKEWAEGEGAKVREKEELVGELSQAMEVHGRDPTSIREAMGR
jgi:hypothetical protein